MFTRLCSKQFGLANKNSRNHQLHTPSDSVSELHSSRYPSSHNHTLLMLTKQDHQAKKHLSTVNHHVRVSESRFLPQSPLTTPAAWISHSSPSNPQTSIPLSAHTSTSPTTVSPSFSTAKSSLSAALAGSAGGCRVRWSLIWWMMARSKGLLLLLRTRSCSGSRGIAILVLVVRGLWGIWLLRSRGGLVGGRWGWHGWLGCGGDGILGHQDHGQLQNYCASSHPHSQPATIHSWTSHLQKVIGVSIIDLCHLLHPVEPLSPFLFTMAHHPDQS